MFLDLLAKEYGFSYHEIMEMPIKIISLYIILIENRKSEMYSFIKDKKQNYTLVEAI